MALLAGLALCVAALLAWAQRAGAEVEAQFCPPGEAAGECGALVGPSTSFRGLALDREDGRLYVADEVNHRVSVFAEESGEFLFAFGWGVETGAEAFETCTTASGCQKGIAGEGTGQFDEPTDVAIDNESAEGKHAIYVVDEGNFRVQRLDPEGETGVAFTWMIGKKVNEDTEADLCTAESGDQCGAGEDSEEAGGFSTAILSSIFADVGAAGTLHVLDSPRPEKTFQRRLQRFDPDGEAAAEQCTLAGGGRANGVGADAAGNVWTASEEVGVHKYDPACAELFADTERIALGLALDEEGNAFAAQGDPIIGGFRVLTAYAPGGAKLARFGYGDLDVRPEGVEPSAESEWVFASQREEGILRLGYPERGLATPGPIVAVPLPEAKEVSNTKATLEAEVNPEGKATEAVFRYLEEESFEEQGGFEGPATRESEPIPLAGEGFSVEEGQVEALVGCTDPVNEASEEGKCLTPETVYRWEVVATNPDNPEGEGQARAEGKPFETKEAIELGEVWASEVGTDTARLWGEVNPLGIPATGYFEYIPTAAYEANLAAEAPPFEGAEKAPDVDGGDSPIEFGGAEGLTAKSALVHPLKAGTAYRFRLVATNELIGPEERPSEDEGELLTFTPAAIEPCPNEEHRIGPGALLPDCRAYEMVSPVDKAGGEIRVLKVQELQFPGGLEQSTPGGERLTYSSYRAFADALSAPHSSQYIAQRLAGDEWDTHALNPPRGRPLNGTATLELEFRAFSEDLCQTWLTTFAEFPELEGAPAPPPGFVEEYSNLLRREDRLCGPERFEALAPLGETPEGAVALVPQGISADGSRALVRSTDRLPVEEGPEGHCEEPEPEEVVCETQLYEAYEAGKLRLACVLPGGAPHTGPCTAGSSAGGGIRRASVIGALSADGQRAYWSDEIGSEGGELYLRSEGAETLEVSAAAEAVEATSGSWFWGAARDGSRAIFTTGDLATGNAHLYAWEPGTEASEKIASGVWGVLGMSADARGVYFVSDAALTGAQENSEGDTALAGQPNLYLHEAGEGGGALTFIASPGEADFASGLVSRSGIAREPVYHTSRVTPDAAHAAFLSRAPLTGYDTRGAASGEPLPQAYLYDAGSEELLCASCNPSGARAAVGASLPAYDNSLHAPRLLADDGTRLYFDTGESLVPRDANARADVYQWERAGTGGCDVSDPGFSAPAGGCIELISSGQSERGSNFVEASASGDDVFFTTLSSLLPQDPGLIDIYDARVGGGLPVPPTPPAPCEAGSCREPTDPPEPPSPASPSYTPPAGAPEAKPNPCRRAARRARGLSRRAKALRRGARRSARPPRRRSLRRRSARLGAKAKKTSRRAKRCRLARRGAAKPRAGKGQRR